jgi:SnoaL-like domain
MAQETAKKFVEALHELEADRNVEKIASLFSDDAEINNVVTVENSHDLNPQEFWTKYRDNFGEVSSEFSNKIYGENNAALEWTTIGTNTDGGEIKYEGVSILEIEDDKITRFFAYFNPAKLGEQLVAETAKSKEA